MVVSLKMLSCFMKTTRPIRANNFLIDSYLREINEISVQSRRTQIFKYLVILNYCLVILKDFASLYIKDQWLRVLLFDPTLFIGGIREYNSMVFMLAGILGIFMFKYLHMTSDQALLRWIDLLFIVKSELDPATVSITKYHLDDLDKVRLFAKYFYKLTTLVFFTFGKFE